MNGNVGFRTARIARLRQVRAQARDIEQRKLLARRGLEKSKTELVAAEQAEQAAQREAQDRERQRALVRAALERYTAQSAWVIAPHHQEPEPDTEAVELRRHTAQERFEAALRHVAEERDGPLKERDAQRQRMRDFREAVQRPCLPAGWSTAVRYPTHSRGMTCGCPSSIWTHPGAFPDPPPLHPPPGLLFPMTLVRGHDPQQPFPAPTRPQAITPAIPPTRAGHIHGRQLADADAAKQQRAARASALRTARGAEAMKRLRQAQVGPLLPATAAQRSIAACEDALRELELAERARGKSTLSHPSPPRVLYTAGATIGDGAARLDHMPTALPLAHSHGAIFSGRSAADRQQAMEGYFEKLLLEEAGRAPEPGTQQPPEPER
ncbi:hypothetical protein PAPYR_11831 [Paratrimastix pyriformis]|uniref:Uncharacterized protein n=1 Tax=Paratrimastix pyriformis TaxID=342808 RepID=A0ABQ8U302_9EUKA|nr:hypothetical protein PAPYR_11831 [Paratrimastix pyriformis]